MKSITKITLIIFFSSLLLFSIVQCSRRTESVDKPTIVDSDMDGLSDDYEVTIGTDPLKADTDGDGLNDFDETQCKDRTYKTDPLNPDTDGDGINDSQDSEPSSELCDPGGGGSNDDQDNDGRKDLEDNCKLVPNYDQVDFDGDGIGDICDNCETDSNHDQSDREFDGVGDMCDNCPDHINPYQYDFDENGIGMACDGGEGALDTDEDGIINSEDKCPLVPDPNQYDADSDGFGDECDNCIDKENIDQVDTDGDGTGDACELPPTPDDSDGDGISDSEDLCPDFPHTDNNDSDSDGVGNVCDKCPSTPDPSQDDENGDGVGDACEDDGGGETPDPDPEPGPGIVSICTSDQDSVYSEGAMASRITVTSLEYDYYIFQVTRNLLDVGQRYAYYKLDPQQNIWTKYTFELSKFNNNNINIAQVEWREQSNHFYKVETDDGGNYQFFIDNPSLDSIDDSGDIDNKVEIRVMGYTSDSSESAWSESPDMINPYSLDSCDSVDNPLPEISDSAISHVKIKIRTGISIDSHTDPNGGGVEPSTFDDLIFYVGGSGGPSCNFDNVTYINGSLSENTETTIVWDNDACDGINDLVQDDFKEMYIQNVSNDKLMIKEFKVYFKYNASSQYHNIYYNPYVYQTLEYEPGGIVIPQSFDWSFKSRELHFRSDDYAIRLELKVKDEDWAATDSPIKYKWQGNHNWRELDNIYDNGTQRNDFIRGQSSYFHHYWQLDSSSFSNFYLRNDGTDMLKLDYIKINVFQCYGREKSKFEYTYLTDISIDNSQASFSLSPSWVRYWVNY